MKVMPPPREIRSVAEARVAAAAGAAAGAGAGARRARVQMREDYFGQLKME